MEPRHRGRCHEAHRGADDRRDGHDPDPHPAGHPGYLYTLERMGTEGQRSEVSIGMMKPLASRSLRSIANAFDPDTSVFWLRKSQLAQVKGKSEVIREDN